MSLHSPELYLTPPPKETGFADKPDDEHPGLSVVHDSSGLRNESSLPLEHYSEVSDVKNSPRDSHSCKYGEVIARRVKMDDHTEYDIRVAIPNELRSDTAIASGTAWWTHPDLEHNQKAMRGALRLGYVAIMIGPPSGFRAEDVSLSKGVYDMFSILDNQLPEQEVNPELIIATGDSRAAMMGIMMSVAKDKVPYADVTAPGPPRAFTAKEWPRVVGHLGIELASTMKETGWEYAKRGQLHRYIKTLAPKDPSHAFNAVRILPGLSNGETGRFLHETDPSTAIHIDEFKGDYWALNGQYEKIFQEQGRNNVTVVYKDGTHVAGIARSSTRRDKYARLERLRDIRGFDGPFDKVDFINDILPLRPFSEAEEAAGKNGHRFSVPFINVRGLIK